MKLSAFSVSPLCSRTKSILRSSGIASNCWPTFFFVQFELILVELLFISYFCYSPLEITFIFLFLFRFVISLSPFLIHTKFSAIELIHKNNLYRYACFFFASCRLPFFVLCVLSMLCIRVNKTACTMTRHLTH